jgi:hypothetical protein
LTGNRRDATRKAGRKFLLVAFDEHVGSGHTGTHSDERARVGGASDRTRFTGDKAPKPSLLIATRAVGEAVRVSDSVERLLARVNA